MTTSPLRRAAAALTALALVTVSACSGDDTEGSRSTATSTPTGGAAGTAVPDGDGRYQATIHRTDDGVPHIVADDVAGLAFGQGWASGEDRACDLADQILKIRGERAAHFGAGDGDEHVTSDVAWRTIGIYDRAAEDWDDVPADARELITAYANGWNAQLDSVGVDGLTGWCAGADWVAPLEPVDIYAYARSTALLASSAQLTRYLGAQPPSDAGPEAGPTAAPASVNSGSMLAPAPADTPTVASNGWAIGAERTASGGGMLLANPHFPWEGELRFWEVHLVVPGELNVYGAQLSGVPGVGIGFTEQFGWTHTVSAGSRFTAYRLDLADGDPTSYRYGDEVRAMTSTDLAIEVLQPDGTVETVNRTAWFSHYGPVIDFPGFGWTEDATISFRDANLDNDEFIEHYLAMLQADDLDDVIDIHRRHNGVPLFNTIAASADGRAWYADTSATPNLSPEALAAYEVAKQNDPIVATAAASRAVLLDGSDPLFEWVEADGARDPGLVPFDDQPMVERDDYVFNANDSFWMPHATDLLAGDYSPLHGDQGAPRSPRTRENAVVLGDTSSGSLAGDDGVFDLDELTTAALANEGFTARELREPVVQRCQTDPVQVLDPLPIEGGEPLPAGEVDLTAACAVLEAWDGVYDLDSVGPVLWREFLARFDSTAFTASGDLWSDPFDADRPLETPSGLAPPLDGDRDPVLENLARAVQLLDRAGLAVDTPLGDAQFAVRGDTVVPIHGGDGRDGVTNIVGYGRSWSTLEPVPTRGGQLAPWSALATTDDRTGYLVNNGSSFVLAVAWGDDGPEARVHLTYGNTAERSSPAFATATRRFSAKDWRVVLFELDDVTASPGVATSTVRG